jgi:hypothetical protein
MAYARLMERAPFQAPELSERWTLMRRAAVSTVALFALISVAGYFLPSHVVNETRAEPGDAWPLAASSLQPDREASAIEPRSEGTERTAVALEHSEYTHSGVLPPLFLLVIIALAVVDGRRPRFGAGFAAALTSLLAYFGFVITVIQLDHLFDDSQPLPVGSVYAGAVVALLGAIALWIILVPVQHIDSRRRQTPLEAETPALPAARLR